MDVAAEKGEIIVIEEVVRELERKDDDICKWVKQRNSMIIPIDQEVQNLVVEIMSKFGKLVDTRKSRSGCDPWVIALAKIRNLTVVTGERATGNLDRPKIPDVCKELSVPCLGILDFFRAQGWRV